MQTTSANALSRSHHHRSTGRLPRWETLAIVAIPFVLATMLVSVSFPLATYTLSLAMFGLAHVLSELRYIDLKYGRRIGQHLRWTIGALLVSVVSLRVAQLMGWMSADVGRPLEVGIVLLLSLSVMPKLMKHGIFAVAVGMSVSGLLIAGLAMSPIHTLLILAILHNLTPLAFLADALPSKERTPVLTVGVLIFIAMPLFIATGTPFRWMAQLGVVSPEASILPVGPLAAHIGAYIHPAFHDARWALYAFSGVVFIQCMHYAVVIHILPRLLERDAHAHQGLFRWPDERRFTMLMVVASVLLFGLFVWSFGTARSVYGIAAAVHAWVEIPILMLALFAGLSAARQ